MSSIHKNVLSFAVLLTAIEFSQEDNKGCIASHWWRWSWWRWRQASMHLILTNPNIFSFGKPEHFLFWQSTFYLHSTADFVSGSALTAPPQSWDHFLVSAEMPSAAKQHAKWWQCLNKGSERRSLFPALAGAMSPHIKLFQSIAESLLLVVLSC